MNVQECWNVQHTGPSTLFENSEGTIQLIDTGYESLPSKRFTRAKYKLQNNSTICEYLYDCKCFIHSK